MKRTRLKPMSEKRRAGLATLIDAREQVERRARGLCEANTPACPIGPHAGSQAHHVLRRSAGGGHTPDNLLWVCDAAHAHIHGNPAESMARGWLKSRWVR